MSWFKKPEDTEPSKIKLGGTRKPRSKLLQKTPGQDRRSVLFMSKALDIDVVPPLEIQNAIQEKLVESTPPTTLPPLPSVPKRPPPVGRRLERGNASMNLIAAGWQSGCDSVMAKWNKFEETYDQAKKHKLSTIGESGLPILRKALNEQAQAAITAAENYLKLPDPTVVADDKQNALDRKLVRDLKGTVEPIPAQARRLLKSINAVLDEPDKGLANIGQAVEVDKRGIRIQDLKLGAYGDDKLDRENSKEDFAAGAVNKVSKLVYGDETKIFKAEAVTTSSGANMIGICGIDKSAPRFGNRNIATKEISNFLGGSVIPESCYTIHNGEIGLLMDMAPGKEMKAFKKKGFDPSPPSEELVASLQSQLNELEWTDLLTGQGDRHDGNYMIDVKDGEVKITGIDNDFCLGKNQDDYGKYGSKEDSRFRRGPYWGYNSAELPPLIDGKAYDAIVKKDFDTEVRPKLQGLLSEEEIEASAKRFTQMKQHAESLTPNYVVSNWKTWRSPKDAAPPEVNATEFLKASKVITLSKRDFGGII